MSEHLSIGDRVRELRRRRGLTQQELVQAAGLSPQVVRTLELGGSVPVEALLSIAQVLGVQTATLMAPGAPEPFQEQDQEAVLADIRSALLPPEGPEGPLWPHPDVEPEPDLPRLRQAVAKLARLYDSDQYDEMAQLAPALVRSAHYHVAALDGTREAVAVRGDLLGIVSRYLVQIRQHDLALIALYDALTDAQHVENEPLISSVVTSQAWTMMRQGRFDDAERLCTTWADVLQPRLSTATPEQLAAWGALLRRAGAAALRNNKPEEAEEYTTLATTAATKAGREIGAPGHATFGPVTAGIQRVENKLLQGHPDQALAEAKTVPKNAGRISGWPRHQVNVAHAAILTGDIDRATEIMTELRFSVPGWLRYQLSARIVTQQILKSRAHTLNDAQRALADFFSVEGSAEDET